MSETIISVLRLFVNKLIRLKVLFLGGDYVRDIIPYPRIRDLREDHDLKQSAIAAILNVTQTTYSKYEIGTTEIPVRILIQLARLYNTSIDYLLGETDNPRRYE